MTGRGIAMRAAAFLFGLLLVTPALGHTMRTDSAVNSAAGVAPKTTDFVTKAATHDMFEIQSSRLAVDTLTGQVKNAQSGPLPIIRKL